MECPVDHVGKVTILHNHNEDKLIILLSTYNGEKHLDVFIQSLEMQTYQNWVLLIRDDRSQDKTLEKLKKYASLDKRIAIYDDPLENVGPWDSFFCLLNHPAIKSFDYFMFADQDDVWLPEKINDALLEIKKVEVSQPSNKPVLCYTDLIVVDNECQIIADSLWKYQKLAPWRNTLNNLLSQNIVTGCTMIFNKALHSLVRTPKNVSVPHDHWVALTASLFGCLHPINKANILYRQHGNNAVGALKYGLPLLHEGALRFKNRTKKLDSSIATANELYSLYGKMIDVNKIRLLKAYSSLSKINRIKRVYYLFKFDFFKYGFWYKLYQLSQVLL